MAPLAGDINQIRGCQLFAFRVAWTSAGLCDGVQRANHAQCLQALRKRAVLDGMRPKPHAVCFFREVKPAPPRSPS